MCARIHVAIPDPLPPARIEVEQGDKVGSESGTAREGMCTGGLQWTGLRYELDTSQFCEKG